MARRLLTPADLYAFYLEHSRSFHFSAKDEDDEIVVSLPAKASFEMENESALDGLSKVHLKACHTLENDNQTYISDEVMTAALPSFANRPILAYIFKDEDGEYQFNVHAKHINEDGELVYDERPVGIVPESCNAHLEYDEENHKTYVHIDGYLFNEYSKAREILEREGTCSVSVELAIRDFSYNAKKKLLVFNSFYFEGVTILGVKEDGSVVKPGMAGSNIKLADFQKKNNAEFSQEKMQQILESIEFKLNELTTYSKGKEEQNVEDQNTVTTAAPVVEPEVVPTESKNTVPAEPENQPENAESEAVPVEPTTEPENGDVEPEISAAESEGVEPEGSSSEPATFSKTFELAHDDIRRALYELLAAFEEANGEWYYIEKVYDDHFIYSGDSGYYKQNYTKTNEEVAFVGEPIHMNPEFLTDDELAIINEMRNNYAGLVEKLAQYESEPDKLKILESKDYALIKDTEEFKKLCDRKTYFSLTVDEVKAQCDNMLMEKAKELGSSYASNDGVNQKYSAKPIPVRSSVSGHGRYGAMFVK